MPRRSLTREAVRELDRRAIEELGVPGPLLMENAGRACADEAQRMLGDDGGMTVVLAGPGNNGGDGYVIARTLVNRGHRARVLFVGSAEQSDRVSGDTLLHRGLWDGLGGETLVVPAATPELAGELSGAALIVDALFGTGLTRELKEPWRGVTEAANAAGASGVPVLAVDVPSGIDANTGDVLGAAVRASTTVTFVADKPGLGRGAGAERAGRVVVAEIGIPRHLIQSAFEEAGDG